MIKKFLSAFLALVMVLSLLPSSVLAASPKDPDNNGTTGDGGGSGSSAGGSSHTTRDYTGLRFSLYWGENYDSFKKGNASEIIQIGNTIDINLTGYGNYTPVKESHQSIFKRMGNGAKGMTSHGIVSSKYNASTFCYTEKNYTGAGKEVISKIPVLISPSGNNVTKEKLDAFFLGSGYAKDPNNKDYTNTMSLIKMIVHGTTFKMEDIDFANGRYRDSKGNMKSGVYKLFYEPILYFSVSGTDIALTLRDAIAYNNANSTILNNFGRYMYTMANAVYLEKDEVAIGMTGLKNPLPSISDAPNSSSKEYYNSTIYPLVKKEIASDGRMYNSMGVGVVTGGDEDENKQVPQVIKTYVYIDKVDENGKVTYKKADPSTIENAEFRIDIAGNKIQTPYFEYSEPTETGLGILNDIISVPADLSVTEATEWVNTDLVSNVGKNLTTSAKDVAGYAFGLITDSDTFISNYFTYKEETGNVLNSVNRSLSDANSELLKSEAGANETTLLVRTLGLSNLKGEFVVVGAVPYIYENDIKVGRYTADKTDIEKTPLDDTTKITPANNIVLRYIVKPVPAQYNIIELVDEKSGTSTFIDGGKNDLVYSDDTTVVVQQPDFEVPAGCTGPDLIEWVTNNELPIKDISNGTLPSVSEDGKTGSDLSIPNYPNEPSITITHNLYVKWKVIKPDPETVKYNVPEWRLSKYWGAVTGVPSSITTMSLPITYGCCSNATLDHEGPWNYITRNPNGQLTLPGHLPDNLKLHSWVHSETVHSGVKPGVSINSPSGIVPISGNLNAIKSTDTSGLKVANWLDKDSTIGLLKYDVQNDTKGTPFTKNEYVLNAALGFGAYNLDTYKNGYTYPVFSLKGHKHKGGSKPISPSSASYGVFPIGVQVTFDRYIQQNTDAKKLLIQPEVTSTNTKTTLKYQLNKSYKIYPEYGMLFANDAGTESIKWVVGDQPRLVNPVVYQTLEHKVYVDANSNGTSVATDSRAISNAKKIGESGKQVIYKGAGVNTSFAITKDEKSKNAGLLTAKTYTLDFKDSVKSAWGNGDYNTLNQHTALMETITTNNKANATEKLLIDSPNYGGSDYTGAIKTQITKAYEPLIYKKGDTTGNLLKNGTVVCFTHELIVRGGTLIGAKVTDKNTGDSKTLSIEQIKVQEPSLYEAILNMNLYNETNDKSKTIFSTFEHQTGDALNEGKYGTDLGLARKALDGLESSISSISDGKGWYSEDTTVLVIKEYVTNYNVPSISFSDKISMSVKGLDSPINKNQFFSVLGKGYTYLKYDMKIELNDKEAIKNPEQTSAYFEFSSYSGDTFGNGKQVTNYLVPNATVSDSTNLN